MLFSGECFLVLTIVEPPSALCFSLNNRDINLTMLIKKSFNPFYQVHVGWYFNEAVNSTAFSFKILFIYLLEKCCLSAEHED